MSHEGINNVEVETVTPTIYASSQKKWFVMVNFMCQVDWATGSPDIWFKIILEVSMNTFLDQLTFELVD